MRGRFIITLIAFGISVVVAVIVVIVVLPAVLHFPGIEAFKPSDTTTLIFSISAFGISFVSLYYNIIKEADLEFGKDPFIEGGRDASGNLIPDKWDYFLRVENKGRGKAEKCVGHLMLIDENGKEVLPPSNRSVWRLGPNDYVLDQDIGFQDDLLLFEVEVSKQSDTLKISFPMALTGQQRHKLGGNRFLPKNIDYEEARNYKLFIRLEANTGHMPKQKEIAIGTIIEKTINPNK